VLGSNYLFTSSFNSLLISPACTIGLLSVGVLNLNNMRDIENDQKSKKNTLAVRLGAFKSKIYHYFLIFSSIVLMVIFHVQIENDSVLFLSLIFGNICWLIFHVFKVSKVKSPKIFDGYLKHLVFSTFFYSIILSIYFFEIF